MELEFSQKNQWLSRFRIVFWVVIIVGVVLVFVILLRGQQLVIRNPEAYQAVFLDNGQVYFGKLRFLNRDFLSLTDIYYLRAGTIQQAANKEGESVGPASISQLDLVKLGAELHAPRDEMIINRAHVLFYEDIGENGEVMKLIRKHKQGK